MNVITPVSLILQMRRLAQLGNCLEPAQGHPVGKWQPQGSELNLANWPLRLDSSSPLYVPFTSGARYHPGSSALSRGSPWLPRPHLLLPPKGEACKCNQDAPPGWGGHRCRPPSDTCWQVSPKTIRVVGDHMTCLPDREIHGKMRNYGS